VNPDLRNLIALQDLELKIAFLQKQISEVPVKIDSYQIELQQLHSAHQERTSRLQGLGKQRRTLEGGVDLMRAKLSKLRDQLMTVKTNKEYTAMLHEIKMAEDEIRAEEDRVLEIMEKMETLEAELKNGTGDLNKKVAELEAEVRKTESSVPGMEAEMAKLREGQVSMQSLIESELLNRYRRIADARKGLGLAEAKDELCTACHVRIRPQVLADILHTGDIFVCDSCSRILFSREAL
jgi:predicted  nucleic acid-binding Zn-ribbon protein